MYDTYDLMLAKNMLDLAREAGDEDDILASRLYLAEVRQHQDRSPVYDRDETDAYDLIL